MLRILLLTALAASAAPAEDPSSLAREGAAVLRAGDLKSAEKLCRRALELAPRSQEAHTCLYNVFTNGKRFEEGLEAAERNAAEFPEDDLHVRARARIHYRRAQHRAKSGDADGQVEDYLAAIRVHPEDMMSIDDLGTAYFERKDYREAVRYYNRSLKMDLRFADGYALRGKCFLELGRPVMALADFERAKDLKPGLWRGLQKDIDAATTLSLRRLNPKEREKPPYQGMPAIIYTIEDLHREWREEIAYYTGILSKSPKDSDAFYGRGALRFELREYGEAALDFKAAMKLYPGFWGKQLPDLLRQAEAGASRP